MNPEQVVFIGGSGRCGTTLLARLFDAHPRVAALFEVHPFPHWLRFLRHEIDFATALERHDQETREALADPGYNWRILPWEAEQARRFLATASDSAAVARRVVRRWLDELHCIQMARCGAARIVHKTPRLARFVDDLFTLWPASRFLHVIRDPRDVIASYLAQPWGPSTVPEAVDWYCRRVGGAIAQGRGRAGYRELRLEDLLRSPSSVLDDLQRWVGVAPHTRRMQRDWPIRKQKDRSGTSPELLAEAFHSVVDRLPEVRELYPD